MPCENRIARIAADEYPSSDADIDPAIGALNSQLGEAESDIAEADLAKPEAIEARLLAEEAKEAANA